MGSGEKIRRNRQRQPWEQGPGAGSEPAILGSSKDACGCSRVGDQEREAMRSGGSAGCGDCWRPSAEMLLLLLSCFSGVRLCVTP